MYFLFGFVLFQTLLKVYFFFYFLKFDPAIGFFLLYFGNFFQMRFKSLQITSFSQYVLDDATFKSVSQIQSPFTLIFSCSGHLRMCFVLLQISVNVFCSVLFQTSATDFRWCLVLFQTAGNVFFCFIHEYFFHSIFISGFFQPPSFLSSSSAGLLFTRNVWCSSSSPSKEAGPPLTDLLTTSYSWLQVRSIRCLLTNPFLGFR